MFLCCFLIFTRLFFRYNNCVYGLNFGKIQARDKFFRKEGSSMKEQYESPVFQTVWISDEDILTSSQFIGVDKNEGAGNIEDGGVIPW